MKNVVINLFNRTKTKTYNFLPYHFYTEQNFNNSFNKSYKSFSLKKNIIIQKFFKTINKKYCKK